MSPSCAASASRTARAIASGRSRAPAMSRLAWWMATGNMRPALSTTSASIRPDSRAPSAVADIGEQPQLRPQLALQVEAKRQGQVGFEGAFVDLVEDDGGDPVEAGVGLQTADQQALGDDLDAGLGGDRLFQPGAKTGELTPRAGRAGLPCGWPRRGWRGGAAPA